MKICICTQVKNDGDIIESFCRYQVTYADHIIVTDDRSVDNTVEIINALIKEGLPITLIQIPCKMPIPRVKISPILQNMCAHAFDAMGMDWVIPLDVDEFLFCGDGSNPRRELEALSEFTEYRFYWRTGIYYQEPLDNTVFLPAYFDAYRDPALETFPKTLLSRKLAKQGGVRFGNGKHQLAISGRKHRESVPVKYHDNLLIAHFPLRSIAHTITKIANGWHFYQYCGNWDGSGFHWKEIYDYLSRYGTLTPEHVQTLSKEYALQEEQKKQPVLIVLQPYGALRSDFLNGHPIRLKYTDYTKNVNYMNPILAYYELLIENLRGNISS